MFNFIRCYQILFPSGYAILKSQQHCMRVLVDLYAHQNLILFLCVVFFSHSNRYIVYILEVLISISLMINDVDHLLMCLPSLYLLWWNGYLKLVFILIGLFVFLLFWRFKKTEGSLCILDVSLLLNIWFTYISSQSLACLLIYNSIFHRTKIFNSYAVHFINGFLL